MFEGILKRILGSYLEGFDEEELSVNVWKGDINLKNVKIKSNVIDKFKLPIKIIYGNIGKLHAKVPWRSLSSSPVVIELESLYLIITPQMKKDWQIIDFNNYEDKLKKLVSFGEELQQKIKNDGKDQSSYFGNLGMKIFDNIQITIKNIHIRFEDMHFGNHPYSFGLTLKELSAQTCDENWEYNFFDRTLSENIDKPIFKLLKIEKFIIDTFQQTNFSSEEYINSLASEQCSNDKEMHRFMETLFPKENSHIDGQDYIIEPI